MALDSTAFRLKVSSLDGSIHIDAIRSLVVPNGALLVSAADEATLNFSAIVGGGTAILAADASPTTSNTLTALAGLSRLVSSGVVYTFTILLRLADSNGEGVKIDLNGGSAAMTWFWASYKGYDETGALMISKLATALSDIAQPDIGSAFSGLVEIRGSFQPGDGTFIPRIAQQAHVSGSIQALKGSMSKVEVSA